MKYDYFMLYLQPENDLKYHVTTERTGVAAISGDAYIQ